jgi:hypothetical protein
MIRGAVLFCLLHFLGCCDATKYNAYPGRIGPTGEQYNSSEHYSCSSTANCVNETAAKCDTTDWCHSFAIETSSKTAQMYQADYNESLYPHPKWTFYSHYAAPPTPPTAPPTPAPAPTPLQKIDYCRVKSLAFSYAKKIMPGKDLGTVFDALQLGTKCNMTYRYASSSKGGSFAKLPANAIYVDAEKGDDTKSGGLQDPVHTVFRALTISRTSPLRNQIFLRAGTYYLASTLELNSQDDGLAISSYPNERAVLSGGVLLAGLDFQPVPSPLPGGDKIKVAELHDVCSPSLPDFQTLFVGGRRAIRARYPNANPETQGLHTPQSGYLGPTNAAAGGKKKQTCTTVAASKCPMSVPAFGYGTFNGANESGAGYSPSFEPYWCGKWTGISTFSPKKGQTPGGHLDSWNATQLAEGGATLHMTRGTQDIWANFQWQVEGLSRSGSSSSGGASSAFAEEDRSGLAPGDKGVGSEAASGPTPALTLKLGKGGVQFPRGTSSTGWWFVDGVLAELDSANEWYFDPPTRRLYWWPNSTNAAVDAYPPLVAARLTTLMRVVGARVQLTNLTFAHTERTVLAEYETPSGGGYSVHRGAMVELRDIDGGSGGSSGERQAALDGAVDMSVAGCTFDSPGGNGLLVEGRSTAVTIVNNEFKWVSA